MWQSIRILWSKEHTVLLPVSWLLFERDRGDGVASSGQETGYREGGHHRPFYTGMWYKRQEQKSARSGKKAVTYLKTGPHSLGQQSWAHCKVGRKWSLRPTHLPDRFNPALPLEFCSLRSSVTTNLGCLSQLAVYLLPHSVNSIIGIYI